MILYHITDNQQWSDALDTGVYTPDAFAADGFIHCSTESQVVVVANRFYADCKDLLLLIIDAELVAAPIIFENLEAGSELFPHIYGPLNIEAVLKVTSFVPNEAGCFHHTL